MNYKTMKPALKLKYIHNHISTVQEWMGVAIQHLEWAMDDVNFIHEISENEDENKD